MKNSKTISCKTCGVKFNPKGIKNHERVCKRVQEIDYVFNAPVPPVAEVDDIRIINIDHELIEIQARIAELQGELEELLSIQAYLRSKILK